MLICNSGLYYQSKRPILIQRRGAEFSLMTVARHFGPELTKALPYLWESMVGPLKAVVDALGEHGFVCVQTSFGGGGGSSSPVLDMIWKQWVL